MGLDIERIPFAGNLLMLGFGSIGQAMLPLLLRHLEISPSRIRIISADDKGGEIARQFGVAFMVRPLVESNYRETLDRYLNQGDFLLNLSVDLSSLMLIDACWRLGAMYLDTCIEPWAGLYANPKLSVSQRSNYALREEVLTFRRAHQNGPTAILTQGANPGLVSQFVRQALLDLAAANQMEIEQPTSREDWAGLARRLDIKTIHISERDTQTIAQSKQRDEFINTWSVHGFVSEALQPAELGWGSHERHWPADAERHGFGCDAAIYLNRPGVATRVRSWTPLEGPYHGFLISHGESISIADHLSLFDEGKTVYRPTVLYAYHPCDHLVLSIHEFAGKNFCLQSNARIIRDEITEGMDEVGVLLMGNAKGAYWYGSRLSIQQARQLAPYNNATSMQVAAGVLGGIGWALANPRAGIVEPGDLRHDSVLKTATPYLGELLGVYTDWNPLLSRSRLFSEDLEWGDPWQFKNFRVT